MLDPTKPALVLAPMDGVTDAPMRALQGVGGVFTFAVSEFLRVSHLVPPKSAFYRRVPELLTGGRTPSGLPVQVQLLGGDHDLMAVSAVRAHELGAAAIDINFGCPAPTVNRHDGGATLLKYPARIRDIVRTVREALPHTVPVSAKLRLGWDCAESVYENAAMATEGGASWLTIHARTRAAGYAPPVFWGHIGRVREQLRIPVVANGDIWTIDDFRRCRDETGCQHFMLGRGGLADPHLARRVATELGLKDSNGTVGDEPRHQWSTYLRQLVALTPVRPGVRPEQAVGPLKQWLRLAASRGTFSDFDRVKHARSIDELFVTLDAVTQE